MSSDEIVIYRCTECGYLSTSLAYIHGHVEGHNPGLGPWGLIPDPRKTANPDHLNTMVEAVRVEEFTTHHPDEVEARW